VSILKLLLTFAPWLALLAIARDSLFSLKLGLIVGLVLSVVMGLTHIHRGLILWIGLSFFSLTTVAVVGFENIWVAQHMGVLANGALAASSWFTIVIGKPFSEDYARDHVDRSLWHDPAFIRTNVIVTSIWAAVFTVNAVLAYAKMVNFALPGWAYEVTSYVFLLAAVVFTSWYSQYVHRVREAERRQAALTRSSPASKSED
jgi:hypothetical protein